MAKKKTPPPTTEPTAADLAHIAEGLRPLAVPIDTIRPDARNARKHGARNMEAIRASLDNFGQVAPLIVHPKTSVVLAGNARLAAALELGWQWIAVLRPDRNLSDAELTALAIADNRTAELAEWDDPILQALLAELGDERPALVEELTLDDLIKIADEDEPAPAAAPPDRFEVVVECRSAEEQREWHERLIKQGASVRAIGG